MYMYGLMAVIGLSLLGDSRLAHGFNTIVALILCWAVIFLKAGIEERKAEIERRDDQAQREFGLVYGNQSGYKRITDVQAEDEAFRKTMEEDARRSSRLKDRQAQEDADD